MFDVVIAGAGPAGLNAALVLGRARRTVLVCDDGQPRNAGVAEAHGFLSRDGVAPSELRTIGRQELQHYDSVEVRDVGVASARREGEAFVVTLADGRTETARRLLLATGLLDELPPIEGLAPLWGRSAFNCPYCHGWEVRERPIVVLGPDPAAARLALHLTRWSDDVVLVSNGPAELDDSLRALLRLRNVPLREDVIERLEGDGDQLRAVVFASGERLPREAAFLHTPFRQRSDLAEQLGCRLLDDGAVEVNDFGQTSVPGVYAAGDLARRPSLPFPAAQLVLAAGAGALAAVVIDQELLGIDLHAALTAATTTT